MSVSTDTHSKIILQQCYGYMFVFHTPVLRSDVETPPLNVVELGGQAFGGVWFRLSPKGEALMMGLVSFEEEKRYWSSCFPEEQRRGCVSTVRWWAVSVCKPEQGLDQELNHGNSFFPQLY